MFKELMHNLIGSNIMANIGTQGPISGVGLNAGQLTASMQNSVLQTKRTTSKRIFHGNVEVLHVANGYIINIGTREGYEYTTHIAQTVAEVNEIIAAAMVAFQLENS
jgi:hypothetical protein